MNVNGAAIAKFHSQKVGSKPNLTILEWLMDDPKVNCCLNLRKYVIDVISNKN